MTKKYNTPMLQVVSIKNNDIVCSSPQNIQFGSNFGGDNSTILAPGQRGLDDWYEGY